MEESSAQSTFEPADMLVVDSLDQLRVLASDIRINILEQVIPAPRTVAEIAQTLGMAPAKLYYHVRELERVGLIRAVAGSGGGASAQHYRAAARYYHLPTSMLHPDGHAGQLDASAEFIIGALEYSVRQLQRALTEGIIERDPEAFSVQRRTARLSREQAQHFRDRLQQLAQEFCALDHEGGELTVELGFAIFPRRDAPLPPGAASSASQHPKRTYPRGRPTENRRPSKDTSGGR